MYRQIFFPTLKTRPEFLHVKKTGLSWASSSLIVQACINSSVSNPLDKILLSNANADFDIVHSTIAPMPAPLLSDNKIINDVIKNNHDDTNNSQSRITSKIAQVSNITPDLTSMAIVEQFCNDIIHVSDNNCITLPSEISIDGPNIKYISRKAPYSQVMQQTSDNNTNPQENFPTIRVGYIASKKLGNAVARNRAKRRMRELCRSSSQLFQPLDADYVIIARQSILKQPFDKLLSEFAWTLKHIYRLYGAQVQN